MVVSDSIATKLPPYPSAATRKTLSPTQLATLNETISSCLFDVLSLPPVKRSTPAACNFISSYAEDVAFQTLQTLIWETDSTLSQVEKRIRIRVLHLAEALAKDLDVQTLLDLAIVYATTNPNRMKVIFDIGGAGQASTDLISSFVLLLQSDNSPGLYALRKTSYCISCLLHVATPTMLRAFSQSRDFILALARVYQMGLNDIAHSYGGVNLAGPADDWVKIWLKTKVSFMDSFHTCMVCLLDNIASASDRALAVEAETTFDIVFALLGLNSSSGQPRTPFLDQSILADYQQSYDLMRALNTSLRHAVERDARLDLLEASLSSLDIQSSSQGKKNPGALKLLLRSSGALPGIDYRGIDGGKNKEKQNERETFLSHSPEAPGLKSGSAAAAYDPDLDIKIRQVLDIFPDQPSDYIRDLFLHPSYPFAGATDGAARVIAALLEGTAPTWDEVRNASKAAAATQISNPAPQRSHTERRNIFDDEAVDISKFRVGKKSEDERMFLRDRESVEQMKADILRRVEEFSSSEDENELVKIGDSDDEQLPPTVAPNIKVAGDGEESDASDEDSDSGNEEAPTQPPSLEMILELAYIDNPKLFDRDSTTRKSKARADLKAKTGWGDEQIEGWRIMLERDVSPRPLLSSDGINHAFRPFLAKEER
ncbi:hypothetical protein GYMLUDRAFT_566560 [Collybiopsis luxurians FD-317 M1]|uniref:CUE domain-containing protein n=1 Tax=Collybiopsis luxurians FD-317 M1 TaxID=944289 RepID=A0A0D0CYT6_9AGAR|nr:hypothetical protein GYMLUDRAFT_566560 [Collybiopsis luxurians FD-317 M1]